MPSRESDFLSPLPEGSLFFRRMVGLEELGRLPEYRVELQRESEKNRSSPVKPVDLLGKKVSVRLTLVNGGERYINGWVTSFERGGIDGRFDLFEIEMRPWLWFLTQGADCRIFQDKSALEIIQAVFADYSSQQVQNKLTGSFRKRKYCVQYRESDFDFVSRLMEEEGIYYYFTHEEGQHTMVLCNDASAHADVPGRKLPWAGAQEDDVLREDVINDWRRAHSVHTLKYTHTAYDYEAPATSLLADATRVADPKHPTPNDLEVFDYPGGYDDLAQAAGEKTTEGKRLAKLRTEAFGAQQSVATAVSKFRSLAAGFTFTFEDHPDADYYLIIKARFEVAFGGYEAGARSEHGFSCRFDAIPTAQPYRAQPLTPQPIIAGPQTAVVVGPSGDEIHTDALGRVKVQFHWDRIGTKNENSSCWVRVSQPWASKGFGFVAIPRLGDEVVVEFLEGNPDRPLVTGRVYNGANAVPYKLPDNATISGLRTRSSKGGGADNFNELRFEDKKGSEYIWLQAEKDLHERVKHDAQRSIGNDLWVDVTKNAAHSIGENLSMEVGKLVKLKVGSDVNVKLATDVILDVGGEFGAHVVSNLGLGVDGAMALGVGKALDVEVGQALALAARSSIGITGKGVVIDGGQQLTIKAGSGFIMLDAGGVTISGAMVKINSGGSAGAATSPSVASPPAPKTPEEPKENTDPLAS